tara:strand:- start:23806 stop:24969 length:1164 start_codon:yes stop_codon:yes gene_type:complete
MEEEKSQEKILFVDDEPNLLTSIKRNLRGAYNVITAEGPDKGLEAIKNDGPFAVVFSDMQMPGKNGAEFLKEVAEIAPKTVRIMLTGNVDQETTMQAINQGNVFRFLNKPCGKEDLLLACKGGLEQYSLIQAEQELLEKTLMGSVHVLCDILALANPFAFSRAERVSEYACALGERLGFPDMWRLKIASLLSYIGCITLPEAILRDYSAGKQLGPHEQVMFDEHPETAKKLISKIPRLGLIADIIGSQKKPVDEEKLNNKDPLTLGGAILTVVEGFDLCMSQGLSREDAMKKLSAKPKIYAAKIVSLIPELKVQHQDMLLKSIPVKDILSGMVLAEDLMVDGDMLLVPKGCLINETIRKRIMNFKQQGKVPANLSMKIPRELMPAST